MRLEATKGSRHTPTMIIQPVRCAGKNQHHAVIGTPRYVLIRQTVLCCADSVLPFYASRASESQLVIYDPSNQPKTLERLFVACTRDGGCLLHFVLIVAVA